MPEAVNPSTTSPVFSVLRSQLAKHVTLSAKGLRKRVPRLWERDSLDWKGISADEITQRVLDGVKPGSIVLFHNAAEHTPEALAGIIESLQAEGYEFVPISELLLEGETVIYPDGTQKSAA